VADAAYLVGKPRMLESGSVETVVPKLDDSEVRSRSNTWGTHCALTNSEFAQLVKILLLILEGKKG